MQDRTVPGQVQVAARTGTKDTGKGGGEEKATGEPWSHLGSQQWTQFRREGKAAGTASRRPAPTLLLPGVEWRMEVDSGR